MGQCQFQAGISSLNADRPAIDLIMQSVYINVFNVYAFANVSLKVLQCGPSDMQAASRLYMGHEILGRPANGSWNRSVVWQG